MAQSRSEQCFAQHYGVNSALEGLLGLVERARSGARATTVPVPVEKVALAVGIHTIRRLALGPGQRKGGYDALLEPDEGGFTVLLDEGHPRSRQRFSLAHEIAHTFFYDSRALPPVRLCGAPPDPTEERLCNIAAAQLLIPVSVLADAVGREEPSASVVLRLASEFDVSAHAMARALVERSLWDAAILGLAWDPGSPPKKVAALRSPWSATADPFCIPTGSTLYVGDPVERAYVTQSPVRAVAPIRIGRVDAKMHIDCEPYQSGLVCVLRSTSTDSHQLVLPGLT